MARRPGLRADVFGRRGTWRQPTRGLGILPITAAAPEGIGPPPRGRPAEFDPSRRVRFAPASRRGSGDPRHRRSDRSRMKEAP